MVLLSTGGTYILRKQNTLLFPALGFPLKTKTLKPDKQHTFHHNMSLDDLSVSSTDSSFNIMSKHSLDSCVSKWERLQVEKNLHIFYQDDYPEHASEVYRNIGMDEMDEEQRGYVDKVKNYLFPIDGRIATIDKFKYYPEKIMAVLDQISNELCLEEQEESIRLRVMTFLRVLTNLVETIKNRKKGSYTKLVAGFAEMCCLHPEICLTKEDETVWKNLHGINQVISKPDIRLYKHGVTTKPKARTSDMVASVTEVKEDSIDEAGDLEMERGHLESSHLNMSCNSLASDESDGPIPVIEMDLNRKVLGQHAGELLLDLYEFYGEIEVTNMYMPGMILDETKVFFTLLEISSSHFGKLRGNQDLDESDKATIYYSKPLNILLDDERGELIEIFIRLNNIEYNT